MDVVARVQAHPSRSHLHDRLREALSPLPTEIRLHNSDPPNPWAGYRACLADPPERGHLLILQDDTIPCRNFPQVIGRVAVANPDAPVCLFLGALPSSTAARVRRAKPGVRYLPLGPAPFMPLVAVLWPVQKAKQFLAWSETRRMSKADDSNAARWMKATKQQIMVTVPSLVQHDDGEPSVKGGRKHVPWAEGWRKALLLSDDALDYDW